MFLPAVLWFSACSGSRDKGHRFRIFTDDGVTVAETSGGSRYGEELFIYEKVLELQEDEREESLLYGPNHFMMDEDGYFYVADSSNRRVAVFDPEGRFSHSFGREGGGPGEFRRVDIQSIRDGIVEVWDWTQRRTSLFRRDGTLLDVVKAPPAAVMNVWGFFRDPSDTWIFIAQDIPFEGDRAEYEKTLVTVTESVGDTVWVSDFDWVECRYLGTRKAGGTSYQQPFMYRLGGRPRSVFHPRWGILYTTSWDPGLDVYELDGTHSRQIRLLLEPEPPTREEEEYIRQYMRGLIERTKNASSRQLWQSDLDNLRMPAFKAFWQGIEVDDSGFIWLEVPHSMFAIVDEDHPGLLYRILSPEGEYLGETRRPKTDRPQRLSQGHLLTIDLDEETGEYSLSVYTIRPAVEGLTYP